MKKILFILIAVLASNVMAQSDLKRGHYFRDGIYISMSMGGGVLTASDRVTAGVTNTMKVISGAIDVNIRMGAAVKDNFVLHGDILAFVPGVVRTTAGGSDLGTFSGMDSLGIRIFGAGATYYFMPQNIFVSGSAGVSFFDITNPLEEIDSPMGIGVMAKIGKDWWISKNWDIGLSLELAYARAKKETDAMSEIMSGLSMGVSINFTFN